MDIQETEKKLQDFFEEMEGDAKSKWQWLKFLGIFVACFLGLCLIFSGIIFCYFEFYKTKIYPGIYAGPYHLGGLTTEQAKRLIENYNNRLAKEGIDLKVNKIDGEKANVKMTVLFGGDNAEELVRLDSEALVYEAMNVWRGGEWWEQAWWPIYYRFYAPQHLKVPVIYDEVQLREGLVSALAPLENGAHNATIKIKDYWTKTFEIVPEKEGGVFVYEKIAPIIIDHLSEMTMQSIEIGQEKFEPTIFASDIAMIVSSTPDIFSYGELNLNYVSPQSEVRHNWAITTKNMADWMDVARDDKDNLIFILNEFEVKKYLDILRYEIELPPQDAKFSISPEGKVAEFQASKSGTKLNFDKSYTDINTAFKERNYHPATAIKTVSLTMDSVEPTTKNADSNNLGIAEIIGSGFSTFYDSHSTRIKNIANAVKRLNGTIIEPGEVFSAIKYAGPFTIENGFLPEAVIKGREIKDEVGGGMCQIGTTLFRMAMNSGMDIVQRSNHSLVVSYYADPTNHNPGTDAALYEPSIDLKFLNDTGSHLLLQTEIDYVQQKLIFTLWGKPDGRKGWYDPPKVSRWINSGEPETVLTTKLPYANKNCQPAYRGAVASFIYHRVAPTGELIDRVFDSYYRPLPQICMIKVDAIPAGCRDKEVCDKVQITEDGKVLPLGEATTTP